MDPFPMLVVIEFNLDALTWIFKRINIIEADAWQTDHESPMKGVYSHKAKRNWATINGGTYKYYVKVLHHGPWVRGGEVG